MESNESVVDEDEIRVRARDVGDLVVLVPYHLRYHPERSVVAMLMGDGVVRMTARMDLPPADAAEDEVALAASELVGPMAREGGDHVLVLAWEDEVGGSASMVRALEQRFHLRGLPVRRGPVVRDGRWFGCLDGAEPHDDGHRVPSPEEVPAAAEFVALGIRPAPSRSMLAQLVPVAGDPLPDEVAARVRALRPGSAFGLVRPSEPTLEVVAAWLRPWGRLTRDLEQAELSWTAQELAELTVLLRDLGVRDAIVAHLCPGTLPDDALDPRVRALVREALGPLPWHPAARGGVRGRARAEQVVVDRLSQVCRSLPPAQAAPVLTVLGNLAWWMGDGALSRTVLERALELEPGHRLARLLLRMVDASIRPEGHRRGSSSARTATS